MGRLLAIGDIHGEVQLLQRLLALIAPTPQDQLVFLGDYIDRGPHSKEVVEILIESSRQIPTIALMGNHEDLLLGALDGDEEKLDLFLLNGGLQTINSYGNLDKIRIHEPFFRKLRLFYETEAFIFVHAGLRPGIARHHQRPQDLMWIRSEFIEGQNTWGKIVVVGHTPVQGPMVLPGKILVDTGAVFGNHEGFGFLTCAELGTQQAIFHSVSRQREFSQAVALAV